MFAFSFLGGNDNDFFILKQNKKGLKAGLKAAIAIFAVCMPAMTIMLLITRFFLRLRHNTLIEGAMLGMRPAVIGMIAAAALLLIFPHNPSAGEENFIDAWSWVLFGGVLIGQLRRINPILLILLSALLGIIIYH